MNILNYRLIVCLIRFYRFSSLYIVSQGSTTDTYPLAFFFSIKSGLLTLVVAFTNLSACFFEYF